MAAWMIIGGSVLAGGWRLRAGRRPAPAGDPGRGAASCLSEPPFDGLGLGLERSLTLLRACRWWRPAAPPRPRSSASTCSSGTAAARLALTRGGGAAVRQRSGRGRLPVLAGRGVGGAAVDRAGPRLVRRDRGPPPPELERTQAPPTPDRPAARGRAAPAPGVRLGPARLRAAGGAGTAVRRPAPGCRTRPAALAGSPSGSPASSGTVAPGRTPCSWACIAHVGVLRAGRAAYGRRRALVIGAEPGPAARRDVPAEPRLRRPGRWTRDSLVTLTYVTCRGGGGVVGGRDRAGRAGLPAVPLGPGRAPGVRGRYRRRSVWWRRSSR